MTNQQKALFLSGSGGKFIIDLTDIPEPEPGFVLVEVHTASLNPMDWIMRDTGLFIEQWFAILGYDAAGIVKKIGEGVTSVAVGDRV